MLIYTETITVIRAGTVEDEYHNLDLDWSDAAVTRTVWRDVSVQPVYQIETPDGDRQAAITGYKVISGPGLAVDVTDLDHVSWDGDEYTVTGEVGKWKDPFDGSIDHVEFAMNRVRG